MLRVSRLAAGNGESPGTFASVVLERLTGLAGAARHHPGRAGRQPGPARSLGTATVVALVLALSTLAVLPARARRRLEPARRGRASTERAAGGASSTPSTSAWPASGQPPGMAFEVLGAGFAYQLVVVLAAFLPPRPSASAAPASPPCSPSCPPSPSCRSCRVDHRRARRARRGVRAVPAPARRAGRAGRRPRPAALRPQPRRQPPRRPGLRRRRPSAPRPRPHPPPRDLAAVAIEVERDAPAPRGAGPPPLVARGPLRLGFYGIYSARPEPVRLGAGRKPTRPSATPGSVIRVERRVGLFHEETIQERVPRRAAGSSSSGTSSTARFHFIVTAGRSSGCSGSFPDRLPAAGATPWPSRPGWP